MSNSEWMAWCRNLALAICVVLVGCGTAPAHSPAGAQIEIVPADLTTNVDSARWPTLTVDSWADPDAQHSLEELSLQVFHRGTSEALPQGVLASGWYDAVLTLNSDQAAQYTVATRWVHAASEQTRYVSQFHVGPAPVLITSAQFDPVNGLDRNWSVVVATSESTTAAPGVGAVETLVSISVNGASLDCQRSPMSTSAAAELEVLRQIVFSCPEGIAAGAVLSIHVAPGIVSLVGAEPLRDVEGRVDCLADIQTGDAIAYSAHEVSDALAALPAELTTP